MHELSIVMSIISIAEQEARKANAHRIDEIELEIGELSGVDPDALEFAWKQGVRQTMLEQALKKIHKTAGRASCLDCEAEFPIRQYYDACPVCGSHFLHILQGKEMKIRSLIVT